MNFGELFLGDFCASTEDLILPNPHEYRGSGNGDQSNDAYADGGCEQQDYSENAEATTKGQLLSANAKIIWPDQCCPGRTFGRCLIDFRLRCRRDSRLNDQRSGNHDLLSTLLAGSVPPGCGILDMDGEP